MRPTSFTFIQLLYLKSPCGGVNNLNFGQVEFISKKPAHTGLRTLPTLVCYKSKKKWRFQCEKTTVCLFLVKDLITRISLITHAKYILIKKNCVSLKNKPYCSVPLVIDKFKYRLLIDQTLNDNKNKSVTKKMLYHMGKRSTMSVLKTF